MGDATARSRRKASLNECNSWPAEGSQSAVIMMHWPPLPFQGHTLLTRPGVGSSLPKLRPQRAHPRQEHIVNSQQWGNWPALPQG